MSRRLPVASTLLGCVILSAVACGQNPVFTIRIAVKTDRPGNLFFAGQPVKFARAFPSDRVPGTYRLETYEGEERNGGFRSAAMPTVLSLGTGWSMSSRICGWRSTVTRRAEE